jgi:hypothetical protein
VTGVTRKWIPRPIMAAQEQRSLSAMIAILLARAIEKRD